MRRNIIGLLAVSILASSLTSNVFASDVSSIVTISDADYQRFIQRPSALVFAPHGIPFQTLTRYLIPGKSKQNGYCTDGEYALPIPTKLAADTELGFIDVARDRATCDLVVESGPYPAEFWKLVVVARRGIISTPTASGTLTLPLNKAPNSGVSGPVSTSTTTSMPISTQLLAAPATSAAGTDNWGVYTEYNDGANPLFSGSGYSIPLNWVDASVIYDPLVCQTGGTISGNASLYWHQATGWSLDATYNNHAELNAQCSLSCTSTLCTVVGYTFTVKVFARFLNPGVEGFLLSPGVTGGFPTCFGSENIEYAPNGVYASDSGPGNITTTFVTGPSDFCVSWQRRFTKLYQGATYVNHRESYSPDPS